MENSCRIETVPFDAEKNYVRCIAHVMNLVVQDFLDAVKVDPPKDENMLLEDIEDENHSQVGEIACKV